MAGLPGFNALAGAGRGAAKVNVPQAKPPKSIVGQALAGHPNWAAPKPPTAAAGGIGSAGLGLLENPGALTQPQAAGQPAGTSATQTAPTSSPLDAQYYSNVNQNQFNVGQKINSLGLQQTSADTALQQALAQLAYQQPRDQLGLEQGANRNGSLYSTAYTQNQGNLAHSYLTRQTGVQTTHDQRTASIAAQIQGLLAGEPIYEQGQAAASAQRAIAAAAANPATGQPAAQPPTSSSGPAATPPGKASSASVEAEQAARARANAQQAKAKAKGRR